MPELTLRRIDLMQNRIYAKLNLRRINYPKLALRQSRPFGPIMIKAMCDQRHFRWQTGIDKDKGRQRALQNRLYAESTPQNRLRRIDSAESTTQNRLRRIDYTQNRLYAESNLRRIDSTQNRMYAESTTQNRLFAESTLRRIDSSQNRLYA